MRRILIALALVLALILGVVIGGSSVQPAAADSGGWHEWHCALEEQYLEGADSSTSYHLSYTQMSHTWIPVFGTLVPTFICVMWVYFADGDFFPDYEDCLRAWQPDGHNVTKWTREDNIPNDRDCSNLNGSQW